MTYIHPEREEFITDEVRYLTAVLPAHVTPRIDHDSDQDAAAVPPWTCPVDPDYSWDPQAKPARSHYTTHGDRA